MNGGRDQTTPVSCTLLHLSLATGIVLHPSLDKQTAASTQSPEDDDNISGNMVQNNLRSVQTNEKPSDEHLEHARVGGGGAIHEEHLTNEAVDAALHGHDKAWERRTIWKIDLRLLVIREWPSCRWYCQSQMLFRADSV